MPAEKPKKSAFTQSALRDAILRHVKYSLGKDPDTLSPRDLLTALSRAARERMVDAMIETEKRYAKADAKRLYYLSMEFLMGRSLDNNIRNLGIHDLCRETLATMGANLAEVEENEPDAALGNGGLGRLAACFLDSLATLGMPGYGYGINYEYGLFKQEIENACQKEKPDNWLTHGTPWEIERPDEACIIPLYGRVEHGQDRTGAYNPMWLDWKVIVGVPCDMPIVGYGGQTVNFLRLFSAKSSQDFDMQIFNEGDYFRAVEQKMMSETISKVLYPSDSIEVGRELRFVQEYFLVACAVRDIVRRYLAQHNTFDAFPDKVAIQLNDTHPTLTVAELMRILIDENDLSWEKAWEITEATLGYTNHTLMPEALERWPVPLFEHVLPRHLQIVYEINRRFLEGVAARWPGDVDRLRRMSLIEECEPKQVRMANLAIVGSHSVNGVAKIHSDLVKTCLVPDFYEFWPTKFNNKTNGVTPRRWLLNANPGLADLITEHIGDRWAADLALLRRIEPLADDDTFRRRFMDVKRANKERLAAVIRETTHVAVDSASLFDIQVKRIHAYKRQLLNVMHIIDEYLCLIEDGRLPTAPRTYIFAGKAAPGYWAAKQIIRLVNHVGQVINRDPKANGHMKVVFVPDYRVSLAEKIMPAADLSEQISTAGMEASGTGNMKFAMNGALTIGTLDGANIEIMEEVGKENIFIFGLTADEIQAMRRAGSYHPWERYQANPRIRRVMESFKSGLFSRRERGLFDWIYDSILNHGDEYFHLADFPLYIEAQEQAAKEFRQPIVWAKKAILNVARIAKFSSDRTISEYANDIWHIRSVV